MGMIFWCIICFLIGVFVGIITMCFMNASSRYDEHIDYGCFDECTREDNNSFND